MALTTEKPVYDPPFGSYSLDEKKEHHLLEFQEHSSYAVHLRELAEAHDKVAEQHKKKLEQMDVIIAA